jgi:hypothetical protein
MWWRVVSGFQQNQVKAAIDGVSGLPFVVTAFRTGFRNMSVDLTNTLGSVCRMLVKMAMAIDACHR